MKRAVVYTRVSYSDQLEGYSLETQERTCKDYAAKAGYEVVKVFREEARSGKTTDRKEIKKMLVYCEKNQKSIDVILIFKVDRLSRETMDYLEVRLQLKKNSITIESATERIEDTPQGRLCELFLAGFAQFDNEVRAERSTLGMKEAVAEGRWCHQAPLGYTFDNVSGKRNIVVDNSDPVQISLIQESFLLIDNGYSETEARQIVTKFSSIGACG